MVPHSLAPQCPLCLWAPWFSLLSFCILWDELDFHGTVLLWMQGAPSELGLILPRSMEASSQRRVITEAKSCIVAEHEDTHYH